MIGEYIHSIDQKRRVSIPSKFRKALGKRAVITRGLDNCLVVYPIDEWKKVALRLEQLPSGQLNARGLTRILLSGAADVELDKLGRILIPDHLVVYASLQKNVALIGLSNRIEVWDEANWKEYKVRMEKTVGEMAQQIGI